MARIKVEGQSVVYHCVSRVAGGEPLLDKPGRDKLVELLHQLSRFCGLELITYCIMSDHFHVLVRVSPARALTNAELVKRMAALYGRQAALVQEARQSLARSGRLPRRVRQQMRERMDDVTFFMKELKQRSPGGTTKGTGGAGPSGPSGSRACWWRTSPTRSGQWRPISTSTPCGRDWSRTRKTTDTADMRPPWVEISKYAAGC